METDPATVSVYAEQSAPRFLDGYISEAEYAKQREISIRTAQRDRQLRRSPPYTVIGRQVYYCVASVRTWLRARERTVDISPVAPRIRRG